MWYQSRIQHIHRLHSRIRCAHLASASRSILRHQRTAWKKVFLPVLPPSRYLLAGRARPRRIVVCKLRARCKIEVLLLLCTSIHAHNPPRPAENSPLGKIPAMLQLPTNVSEQLPALTSPRHHLLPLSTDVVLSKPHLHLRGLPQVHRNAAVHDRLLLPSIPHRI